MAMRGTPANKAAAFRSYSDESLSDPDLDDNRGKGFSTYNTASKPNTIEVCIFSALVIYIKV